MTYRALVDRIVQRGIDRWTHSHTFVNGLVEKVYNSKKIAELVTDIFNSVDLDKNKEHHNERGAKPIALEQKTDL